MAASVRTPLQTVHESGPHEQLLFVVVIKKKHLTMMIMSQMH
ncbi:hypothetical protein DERF_001598 [Dermatophagoides farinae]|uniref:Uncharacterized protein n=1 Tax=Dermatophagoides farinae TaxID=6954 RepID=A0A922L8T7_DERFA|nr:hypothetical protein DERF_001598 [Dermatophagoides farinae]